MNLDFDFKNRPIPYVLPKLSLGYFLLLYLISFFTDSYCATDPIFDWTGSHATRKYFTQRLKFQSIKNIYIAFY